MVHYIKYFSIFILDDKKEIFSKKFIKLVAYFLDMNDFGNLIHLFLEQKMNKEHFISCSAKFILL